MQQLAALHQDLRALIAALATETARAQPDLPALAAIRMKLSQTSRARATRLEAIFAAAKGASAVVTPELVRVVADAREARLRSGSHIGKWTLRALEADWQGYCRDSAKMRAVMLKQIDAEARALHLGTAPTTHVGAAR